MPMFNEGRVRRLPVQRRWLYGVGLCAAGLVAVLAVWIALRSGGEIKTKVNPKDGAVMVWIPAGDFMMGKDESDLDREIVRYGWDKSEKQFMLDETPKHRVSMDGFWMYQYEVTAFQYRKFCKATGRAAPPDPMWGRQPDKHPAVNVSWKDAKAYADWAGCYLPTEAQWEYAACGGQERVFPWGDEWDRKKCNNAWYHRRTVLTTISQWVWEVLFKQPRQEKVMTTRVGRFHEGVSPFGCEDMAGNVGEWCSDWYDEDYYKSAPARNPKGPSSGADRVCRGGSWYYARGDYCRCSDRDHDYPDYGDSNGGFRCVQGP
ncbi:MAG: formylglycine-generating enzyme family protein [Armatimonadetes bacterium]|nr:formylglycine-generating enzyme family protein [Armatimonadota bacterium]